MKRRTSALFSFFAAALLTVSAHATEFSVMENTSNVSFTSDALLETFTGTSSAVTGTISTDLQNPSSTTGTIQVPTASLRTGVDMRDEHLRGGDWLDAEGHPNIQFEIASVSAPSGATLTHGNTVEAEVTGNLTIKGQTNAVTAPAQVTYYVVESDEVSGTFGIDSNILRVVSSFEVDLEDYGINIPGPLEAKVSETISLDIRVTASEQ